MKFKDLFIKKKSFIYEKVFIKILIFKIIFLTTGYFLGMEYLVRKYVLNYDHDYKRSLIFKTSKIKNTIWGDSGTMTAINNLDNFVNFSSGSQNLQEIELKIKKYYLNKPEGGKVIIQLPLNGFSPYRDRKISDAAKELYLKNSNINFYMSYNYFRKRSYEYLKNFVSNNFQINLESKDLFNSDGSVSYLKTYKPITKIGKELNRKDTRDIYLPKLNFKNDKNKKSLSRIIEFVKSSNIELCLISTPWHKDKFIYKTDKNKYNAIREHYKKLAKNTRSDYFDYTELNYSGIYFSDPVHLNKKGAKKFTFLIDNKCFKSKKLKENKKISIKIQSEYSEL